MLHRIPIPAVKFTFLVICPRPRLSAQAVPAALAAPAFSITAAVKLHYTCTPAHAPPQTHPHTLRQPPALLGTAVDETAAPQHEHQSSAHHAGPSPCMLDPYECRSAQRKPSARDHAADASRDDSPFCLPLAPRIECARATAPPHSAASSASSAWGGGGASLRSGFNGTPMYSSTKRRIGPRGKSPMYCAPSKRRAVPKSG